MFTKNDNVVRCATIANERDASRYAAIFAAYDEDQENENRLREMRAYGFGQRTGLCG